jgi:NADPH:quinone reductase
VLGAARSSDPIPGAVAVINTRTEDLPKRVFELTDGKGVDAVLGAVGGPMFEPAPRCLRIGGRQVAITSTGDRRVSFDLVDFYHNQSRLIGVDGMKLTPYDLSVIADELRQGFEANILKTSAIDAVPFENSVEAYERVASSTARAKQVLPSPSLIAPKGGAQVATADFDPVSYSAAVSRRVSAGDRCCHRVFDSPARASSIVYIMIEHETE